MVDSIKRIWFDTAFSLVPLWKSLKYQRLIVQANIDFCYWFSWLLQWFSCLIRFMQKMRGKKRKVERKGRSRIHIKFLTACQEPKSYIPDQSIPRIPTRLEIIYYQNTTKISVLLVFKLPTKFKPFQWGLPHLYCFFFVNYFMGT